MASRWSHRAGAGPDGGLTGTGLCPRRSRRVLRSSAAWVLVAVTFGLAGTASAENLREVRVGRHPDMTRVVLETDAATGYRILSHTDREILVRIEASALPEAIAGNGEPLLWVRVEPRRDGADVRIQVAGPVGVEEMVLGGPDRVVFDLVEGRPSLAAAPAPTPEPAVAEPALAVPGPASVAEVIIDSDPAQDAGLAIAEAGEAIDEAAAGLGAEADAALDAAAETLGDATDLETGFDGDALAEAGDTADDTPELAVPEAPDVLDAPAAEVPPSHRMAAPPASGGGSTSPFAILRNPVVLGSAAVLIAFLGVLALRRRAAAAEDELDDDAEDADDSPFGSAFAPPAGAESEDPTGDQGAEADDDSVFDVDADDLATAEDDSEVDLPSPLGATGGTSDASAGSGAETAVFAAEAATATTAAESLSEDGELGEEMAAIVQELERRLSHLETRLEEVVDAKERLERQVSAQTEELRVQRAAIARTQRVLRGISRTDEDDDAPVPK